MRTHELLSKPRVSVKEMRPGMEILEPADTLRGNAPVKRIKITSIEFKRFPKHGVIVNEKFSYDHSSEVWLDAFVDLFDGLNDIFGGALTPTG
jgi:hypothetical protein